VTVILICGCPTACVDKTDVRGLARKWIIVAGNFVDLNDTPEEKLADIFARKMKRADPNGSAPFSFSFLPGKLTL
jgi:hypothetical protein